MGYRARFDATWPVPQTLASQVTPSCLCLAPEDQEEQEPALGEGFGEPGWNCDPACLLCDLKQAVLLLWALGSTRGEWKSSSERGPLGCAGVPLRVGVLCEAGILEVPPQRKADSRGDQGSSANSPAGPRQPPSSPV
jgi:hypothetical protein